MRTQKSTSARSQTRLRTFSTHIQRHARCTGELLPLLQLLGRCRTVGGHRLCRRRCCCAPKRVHSPTQPHLTRPPPPNITTTTITTRWRRRRRSAAACAAAAAARRRPATTAAATPRSSSSVQRKPAAARAAAAFKRLNLWRAGGGRSGGTSAWGVERAAAAAAASHLPQRAGRSHVTCTRMQQRVVAVCARRAAQRWSKYCESRRHTVHRKFGSHLHMSCFGRRSLTCASGYRVSGTT